MKPDGFTMIPRSSATTSRRMPEKRQRNITGSASEDRRTARLPSDEPPTEADWDGRFGGHEQRESKPIIRLTFFEDITTDSAVKPWLIKNVMAKGETSTWIAPPGAGKSGLLTSAAVAVARETDWFGFKTKERCAVAYFAFERAALVKRRLLAHRMRDGLKDLPIAVGDQIVDL